MKLILVLGCFLWWCTPWGGIAHAQDATVYLVALNIKAPEQFQGRLEAAISRELRKSPDIRIVSSDAKYDFRLDIACLHLDALALLACSELSSQRYIGIEILGMSFPAETKSTIWQSAEHAEAPASILQGHAVITHSDSQVDDLGVTIEAQFEVDTIDQARKAAADLDASMRAQPAQPAAQVSGKR